MDRTTIGQRVRAVRALRGWTMEYLAGKVADLADDPVVGHEVLHNVNRQHIQRWESGEVTPYYWAIAALAKALDVSVRYLLGLTDRFGSFADDLSK